jgi:hypothetical protein
VALGDRGHRRPRAIAHVAPRGSLATPIVATTSRTASGGHFYGVQDATGNRCEQGFDARDMTIA